MVLYRRRLEDSETLRSLAKAFDEVPDLRPYFSFLVYDNSPFEGAAPECDNLPGFEYHGASYNRGLAAAYNFALGKAQKSEIEWLLLFDQDTWVEPAFLMALTEAIRNRDPLICAFVPKLLQEDRVLSPQYVRRFRNRLIPIEFSGPSSTRVTAFNSAACLRVESVAKIGGFPEEYWLDFLDHIVFHRLQVAGGVVSVLDVRMQHRLASENMENEMSIERYKNMLSAEWRYIRESRAIGGPLLHRLRLMKRGVRQGHKFRNKRYMMETLKAAFS